MKKDVIVIVCYINALSSSTIMPAQLRKNKTRQDLTPGSLHSGAGVCSEPGHTSDGQALLEIHLHKHPCRLCEWSCAYLRASLQAVPCLPL